MLWLVALAAMSVGLLISAAAPNFQTATAIAPAVAMPIVLFGGLFVNTDSLPAWLSWIQYISPVRYGNEALAHTQFDEAYYPE